MAKYKKIKHPKRSLSLLAALLLGLTVALVGMAKGIEYQRSNAANLLTVQPCTGNWNLTDCFKVTNPNTTSVRFAYLLDCYDTTYCTDRSAITTIQPKATITLGMPNSCARWQLDLNWTAPDTAVANNSWNFGAIVEKSPNAVCNCNYTEVPILPTL